MATAMEGGGRLTNRQIARLGAAISADNMESIAEGYMNIEPETVKNIWRENQGKAGAFNRAVIRYWANKNPVDQVQVRITNEKSYKMYSNVTDVVPTQNAVVIYCFFLEIRSAVTSISQSGDDSWSHDL